MLCLFLHSPLSLLLYGSYVVIDVHAVKKGLSKRLLPGGHTPSPPSTRFTANLSWRARLAHILNLACELITQALGFGREAVGEMGDKNRN